MELKRILTFLHLIACCFWSRFCSLRKYGSLSSGGGKTGVLWFCLMGAAVGTLGPSAAAGAGGCVPPLPIRNQSVVARLFLPYEAVSAHTLEKGACRVQLDFSYSSIFLEQERGQGRVYFDMEALEGGLHIDYGITDRFQIGLLIPYRFYYGGFLDNFIQSFHHALGLPNAGRERVANDASYLIWTYKGAVIANETSAHQGLGDLLLRARYALVQARGCRPGVSIRGYVRIPTGDEDDFLGVGEVGAGGGIVVDEELGKFSFNLNGTYFAQPTPDLLQDLKVRGVFAGSFMMAYRLTERFSPLVQLNGSTPLFRNTGFHALDRGILQVIPGFDYRISPRTRFQFGFAEDPIPGTSPDFTVYLALSHTF